MAMTSALPFAQGPRAGGEEASVSGSIVSTAMEAAIPALRGGPGRGSRRRREKLGKMHEAGVGSS
jgi:hypothetical protein